MKLPSEMIHHALEALGRAQTVRSTISVASQMIYEMGDRYLEEYVCKGLANQLSPTAVEMAHRQEAIARSSKSEGGCLGTLFQAEVVFMKPDDYSLVCELIRRLDEPVSVVFEK